MKYFWLILVLFSGSCTSVVATKTQPDIQPIHLEWDNFELHVKADIQSDFSFPPIWSDTVNSQLVSQIVSEYLKTALKLDSVEVSTRYSIPEDLKKLHLNEVIQDAGFVKAKYTLDLTEIHKWIHSNYSMGQLYFGDASLEQDSTPIFSLLLPCENIFVPENPIFLPGSPREYRNGTHRGIDFQANFGTPFRSIADGIVLRADHAFYENTPEQWLNWTGATQKIGRTPDDLFYNVFMGKALIIDHGFNLFPGYRTISIYAHLSEINEEMVPGTFVNKGAILGKTGNSGTLPATRGEGGQSHLHLEIILQGNDGDIYLGETLSQELLYPYLSSIFTP